MNADADPATHATLIVAIAQHRDRAAFATLFGYFAPRVKAYLRRAGMVDARAEDLAQDVLLTVWHKAGQYDPARGAAAAWIFTLARNLRIDAFRHARLAPQVADPSDVPEPAPLADAAVAADQQAQRLRTALHLLPPEQLSLLQLAFFQDRTHSEIEADLGIPLGTVKSRLRLALIRLRAALKDEA
jgi:RNA polymerase sigma-70 factor, ECF subfamily